MNNNLCNPHDTDLASLQGALALHRIPYVIVAQYDDPRFQLVDDLGRGLGRKRDFFAPTKIYNIVDIDKLDCVVHFFGDNVAFDKEKWLKEGK